MTLDPGAALALGELETGGLFLSLFAAVLAGWRSSLRWPALLSWRPRWSLAALLGGELAFVILAASRATPEPPFGWLTASAPVPFVGGVTVGSLAVGVLLTAACLRAGQGTLRVALYVLPVWYGFHDGLWFLVYDLWGGYVPFVYGSMLAPYPAAYFGQFIVDIWQAFSVALVARAAWRARRSPKSWAPLALLAAAWGAAWALAGPLGSRLVADPAGGFAPAPNSFVAMWSLGALPYLALHTAAVYFLLRQRGARP